MRKTLAIIAGLISGALGIVVLASVPHVLALGGGWGGWGGWGN